MRASEVLFDQTAAPISLPVCDHYAGTEPRMRKAIDLQNQLGPIFDLTLDCEDGATAGNEAAQAKLIGALIDSADNQYNRIGVRVHDPDSEFFEADVATICQLAAPRLAYLMIPKAADYAALKRAIAIVQKHAIFAGRNDLPIHALIETHGALADVMQIAAMPAIESLSFGIMDFVSAHGGAIPAAAMHSPLQFTHPLMVRAKTAISAACHAHGKVPSHSVCTDIRNPAQAGADAHQAGSEFGFLRMWSIHPQQIAPIVQALTPPADELLRAAEILQAAQQADWGPIQYNGRLYDRASYRYYWLILQRAQTSGSALPPSVNALF